MATYEQPGQGDTWQAPRFRSEWEDYYRSKQAPRVEREFGGERRGFAPAPEWTRGAGRDWDRGFGRDWDRGAFDRFGYDRGFGGDRWLGREYGARPDWWGQMDAWNRARYIPWGAPGTMYEPRVPEWYQRDLGTERIFGAQERGRSDVDTGYYGESRRGTSGNTWRNYGKRGSELPYYEGWWRPRADILDEAGNIRIEFELPGVPKDDIGLTVGEDFIILQCIKPESQKELKGFYYQNERHFGNFYRKLELPDFVDTNRCSAVLQNGVLKVTCAKSFGGEGGVKSTEGSNTYPVRNKLNIREMGSQTAPGTIPSGTQGSKRGTSGGTTNISSTSPIITETQGNAPSSSAETTDVRI